MRDDRRAFRRPDDDLAFRPTGELMRDLALELQELLRDEVRLARAEVRDQGRTLAKGGAALGAAGAILNGAYLFAGATLIIVFGYFLPLWLAALIWTVVFAALGAGLAAYGRAKLKETGAGPAVQHLKEDKRWASETMHDIRSRRGASA